MKTKDEILELADMIEALDGPSREVDGKIARAIYGGALITARDPDTDRLIAIDLQTKDGQYIDPRPYTASIDASVSPVPDGWIVSRITQYLEKWHCEMEGPEAGQDVSSLKAKTEPLARTTAALRAIASEL